MHVAFHGAEIKAGQYCLIYDSVHGAETSAVKRHQMFASVHGAAFNMGQY